jgi:hypothetical protein
MEPIEGGNLPMRMRLFLSCLVISGCQAQAPVDTTEAASIPRMGAGCEEWGCGSNAATIGVHQFHELRLDRAPNPQGLVVLGFYDKTHKEIGYDVDRDHLLGLTDNGPLAKSALEGSYFLIEDGNQIWVLEIKKYDTTGYWVETFNPTQVPLYYFQYHLQSDPDPDKKADLCPNATGEPEWKGFVGVAVIFRGDHYDGYKKTVEEIGFQDPRFNIGCMGTAVAKMQLLRHTLASSDDLHKTTPDQRQALLKMITADYCGGGTTYTFNGHPLHHDWAQNWHPIYSPQPEDAMEALWTSSGATCLDLARAIDVDPTIQDEILHECKIPRCNVVPVDWRKNDYLISTVPPPPM